MAVSTNAGGITGHVGRAVFLTIPVHRLAVAVEQWPACTVSCFSVPRTGTRHFCILFTFHAIPLHEALSVFCCHDASPSSALVLKTYDCSALLVFLGTMASADFLRQALLRRFGFFPTSASVRSPRARAITFLPYICRIYSAKFGQYWTLSC